MPKILDSFGLIGYQPFASNAGAFDDWVKKHAGATASGTSPNRFGLFQDLKKGVNTEAIAESAKGAKDWADAHMPPGGGFMGKSPLYYHGLTDLKTQMFFAGESEFRAQLVEARKGQEPSRRVDLNQPLP